MTPSVVRHSASRCRRSAMNPASTMTRAILPSSEGWKLKKPIWIQRFDPRTSSAKDEHRQEQDEAGPVERPAHAPVHVRVDDRRRREEHDSPDDVDDLAKDVVARVAGDVVPRHRLEHPEPVGEQPPGGQEEQVVDVAQERAELPGGRLEAVGC